MSKISCRKPIKVGHPRPIVPIEPDLSPVAWSGLIELIWSAVWTQHNGLLLLFRWYRPKVLPHRKLVATPPWHRWSCAVVSSYAGQQTRSCSLWGSSDTPSFATTGSTTSTVSYLDLLLLRLQAQFLLVPFKKMFNHVRIFTAFSSVLSSAYIHVLQLLSQSTPILSQKSFKHSF